jgi:hypothetical protein
MKKYTALALSLMMGWGLASSACADPVNTPVGSGGAVGSGGSGSGGAPPATGGVGSGGAPASGGTASGGETASGGSCSIVNFQIQERSDTDAEWDDNDFETATMTGTCPMIVDVTWPHEAGYEDADPPDANLEENVRITFDAYPALDLTGKQINLTVTLTGEMIGPLATSPTGSYIIQLMSTSTYETPIGGSGGAGSGGDTGSGGASSGGASSGGASSGGASSGGASSGGDTGSGGDVGSGGAATETHYVDALAPEAEWGTLATIGTPVTMSFVLPAAGTPTQYDPAAALKIGFRILPNWTDIGAPPPTFDFVSAQFSILEFSITDAP